MLLTPTIDTSAGPVRGVTDDGVDRFLGIPYAAPLAGEARWLAPTPPEAWREPRLFAAFGPTAPATRERNPNMLPMVEEGYVPGDAYLNLNLWRPSSPTGPLPVLVWIHGGGYFVGASSTSWFDGASFARQGLVFVSFNYRLAATGFAVVDGAPNNRAVLDWLAALTWVKDNIAAFGGDPAQITVAGQSAGGFSVANLLGCAPAHGLFMKAIIASGISDSSTVSLDAATASTKSLVGVLGVEPTVEALARVSPEQIVEAQNALERARGSVAEVPRLEGVEGGLLTWAPVIDGDLITGSAVDGDSLRRSDDIPVLVGTTADEFGWSYTLSDLSDPRASVFADEFMRRPTQRFIDARQGPAPTYRYEFRWRSGAHPGIGSAHSLDLPFLFNNLNAPDVLPFVGLNPPQPLADAMHGAFARFAKLGDPGWPSYARDHATRFFDVETVDGALVVAS